MRQRETAFDINTYYKYKIAEETKLVNDEANRKENYKNLIDYVGQHLTKKELQSNSPSFQITLKPPAYENFSKKYNNNKEKTVKFHEKARLTNLDFGDIPEKNIPIDFITLMAMFDNDEEIKEMTKEQLLGIDLEKIGNLKDKAGRIIDYVDSFNCNNQEEKEKAKKNLQEKIEKINYIQDDVSNVICNISKVDKIIYGKKETKILFHD